DHRLAALTHALRDAGEVTLLPECLIRIHASRSFVGFPSCLIYPIRRGAARVRVAARRASPATATGGGPSPAPRVPRQARGPPVRSLTMRPPHLHNGYANRESETPAAVLRYPISATAAENPEPASYSGSLASRNAAAKASRISGLTNPA